MNFSYIFPILNIRIVYIKEVPDFYNLNSSNYIRVLRLEKSPK